MYIDTYWAYYIDGNQNQFPVAADSAEDFWPCSRAATASCLGLVLVFACGLLGKLVCLIANCMNMAGDSNRVLVRHS